jgi:hypothetical protein
MMKNEKNSLYVQSRIGFMRSMIGLRMSRHKRKTEKERQFDGGSPGADIRSEESLAL